MKKVLFSFIFFGFLLKFVYAVIPEPDALFYGDVFHLGGQPVLADEEQIAVIATTAGGEELSRYVLVRGNSRYYLRVPIGLPHDSSQPDIQLGDTVYFRLDNLYTLDTGSPVQIPAGPYTLPSDQRAPVISLDLNISGDLGINNQGTDYDTWLTEYFTISELSDPANTDWYADSDPDADGRSNLLEYAMGTHPRIADGKDAMQMAILEDLDGSEHLHVSYRQRTNDPSLQYTPEASVDFGATWQSGPAFLLYTSSEPAYTNSEPREIIDFFEWRTYKVVDEGMIGQPLKFRLSVEVVSP